MSKTRPAPEVPPAGSLAARVVAKALPCLVGGGLLLVVSISPNAEADELSVLSTRPDWGDLQPFQRTIKHDDFVHLLDGLYAPGGAWKETIDVHPDAAIIHAPRKPEAIDFRLEFAKETAWANPVPRYWVPAGGRAAVPGKPLAGYTIALDPGHLGGKWARMEERWYQLGTATKPVMEGEMTLITARLLAARLAEQGARVVYVRNSEEPVTNERPADFHAAAVAEMKKRGIAKVRERYDGPADPFKTNSIQWESELLFYRISEIRKRAELVNQRLKPDVTLCIHFNAEEWGDPAKPTLTDKNHLHLLVNGDYNVRELVYGDVRHEMLLKLLNRCEKEELPMASRVAASLAVSTGLPPYDYHEAKARRIVESPYVWARNLLANRLYRCPVIYCESYVMNSKPVFDRVQLGDYEGTRMVAGMLRKSLYREYADGIAEGVVFYFASKAAK